MWKCLSWTAFISCTPTPFATGRRGSWQAPWNLCRVPSAHTKAGFLVEAPLPCPTLSTKVFGATFPDPFHNRPSCRNALIAWRAKACVLHCAFFFLFRELADVYCHHFVLWRSVPYEVVSSGHTKSEKSSFRLKVISMCHTARNLNLITEFTKRHSCTGAFKTCSHAFFFSECVVYAYMPAFKENLRREAAGNVFVPFVLVPVCRCVAGITFFLARNGCRPEKRPIEPQLYEHPVVFCVCWISVLVHKLVKHTYAQQCNACDTLMSGAISTLLKVVQSF